MNQDDNDDDDTVIDNDSGMEEIGLGDRVFDTITEFTGIVVGVYLGLGGEVLFYVQPEGCDNFSGAPLEAQTFNSVRVEKVPSLENNNNRQLDS